MTDREKLKAAFAELRKRGWFARMNFWCCMTCGNYAAGEALRKKGIPEDEWKVVFWHQQDNARAFDYEGNLDGTLHLAHSEGDSTSFEVVGVLVKHGLNAYWCGDMNKKIEVRPHDTTPSMLRRQAA